jgi:hypothetical protein
MPSSGRKMTTWPFRSSMWPSTADTSQQGFGWKTKMRIEGIIFLALAILCFWTMFAVDEQEK